jgi:hypothetical protein
MNRFGMAGNERTALACAVAWLLACSSSGSAGPQRESIVDGSSVGDAASQEDASAPLQDSSAADTQTMQDDAATQDPGPSVDSSASVDAGVGLDAEAAALYNVTLTAKAVTPACKAAGAAATGHATVTIDAANSMIAVSNFTFSGLAGTPTMVHVHFGAAGTDGGIVFHFTNMTAPISQTFTAADYASPGFGAPPTFAGFVAAMRAGNSYLQVHTTACSGGELRAQIQ